MLRCCAAVAAAAVAANHNSGACKESDRRRQEHLALNKSYHQDLQTAHVMSCDAMACHGIAAQSLDVHRELAAEGPGDGMVEKQ